MNERLTRALRRKISAHNRLVHLSTAGAVLGVLLMWVVIYAIGCWLPVFVLTVFRGLDAEAPANLHRWILFLIGGWIVLGWFDRQWRQNAKDPLDDKSVSGLLWRVFMVPPRATFGAWDNPRNSVHLSWQETIVASEFIEHLYQKVRLPVHSVPVELPDDEERNRILTALHATDLIRLRETQREDFIALAHPERVRAFVATEPEVKAGLPANQR